MSASAVVIAAADLMEALCSHLQADGETLSFADTQPLDALKAIVEQRPALVVLERLFAATPRGAALINRIKSDPSLAHLEVRVLSHSGDYVRTVIRPNVPPPPMAGSPSPEVAGRSATNPLATTATVAPPRPVDWHGTRRAPRLRARDRVEILLDGSPAQLIDVSVVGAQALSRIALRPGQKIRVVLLSERNPIRCRGLVAWARFELARHPTPPHYRVGIEFVDADPTAVEAYCERVKV